MAVLENSKTILFLESGRLIIWQRILLFNDGDRVIWKNIYLLPTLSTCTRLQVGVFLMTQLHHATFNVSTLLVLTLKVAFKEAALLHIDTDIHGATRIMIRASTPDGDPRRTCGVRLHGLEG